MSIKITVSSKLLFLICFLAACALLLIATIELGIGGAMIIVASIVTGAGMVLAAWEETLKRED